MAQLPLRSPDPDRPPARTREFPSEEGPRVTVALDFAGKLYVEDCGSDGSFVYLRSAYLDDRSGLEHWWVFEVERLLCPDCEYGCYPEQWKGRLRLTSSRGDRALWLSAKTILAIAEFAASSRRPLETRRVRLSAFAG